MTPFNVCHAFMHAGWLATVPKPTQSLLTQHLSGLSAATADDMAQLGTEPGRQRCLLEALDKLKQHGLDPANSTTVCELQHFACETVLCGGDWSCHMALLLRTTSTAMACLGLARLAVHRRHMILSWHAQAASLRPTAGAVPLHASHHEC